jgi:putative DNA primase/helicase
MGALPTTEALPAPLVTREQWVAWRPQERDGKQTKVPINPSTGRFASATDPETWTDFATAREYATDRTGGVGFVFTDEDPVVGVDLDDCRVPETGSMTEDAEAIVEALDSYTEISPSGTGVHVLVEGTLPDGRNRRDWVECYETARFFTVSGDHVEGTPTQIEPRTDELTRVHSRFLSPNEPGGSTGGEADAPDQAESESNSGSGEQTSGGTSLSDTAVVERARSAANGEKFSRLWRGSTSGYDSHSEADMALCSMLAFWTGGDSDQIDRLFRESGLMREKWDEQHFADGSTYGEKTIERVVASTDEFYDPGEQADSGRQESQAMPTEGDSALSAGAHADTLDESSNSGNPPVTPQPETEYVEETEDLLELIERLQTQVERLEAENQQLREKVETLQQAEESQDTEAASGTWRLRDLFGLGRRTG